jgi:hypothetical protein
LSRSVRLISEVPRYNRSATPLAQKPDIFGWAIDKELNEYTADFDRAEEARGMLIRLRARRKAG